MLGVIAAAALLGLPLIIAACGGSSTAASSSVSADTSSVLRMALPEDPAPLDPDTFYEVDTVLTNAMYEQLLTYAPNSSKIVGMLATSWKVSPNALTYTFNLRHGVQFSDGAPFDSEAAKASFERRAELKGGPSYMVEDIASMETPSKYVFVVHLKQPKAPFLDYLASPFGPSMTNPAELKAHEKNGDHGAAWLETHSAGTGPYELGEIQHSVRYTLVANKHYWGQQPAFHEVDFSIIPDVENQQLQLEGGSLDAILGGLSDRNIEALEASGKVNVYRFPALLKAELWVNPESKVFGSPKVRTALRAYLDNAELTKEVYGSLAKPSTEVYPPGMLPKGAAPEEPVVNKSLLVNALKPYKGEHVVIGWWEDAAMHELANQLQVDLQGLGISATVRQFSDPETSAMVTKPSLRTDLFATVFNPDAAAADTWARIYWYKNAPVNILGCSVPKADELLNKASVQTSRAESDRIGAEAAIAYRNSGCWNEISDVYDTIVVRKGLTGIVHELPWLRAIRIASVKPE